MYRESWSVRLTGWSIFAFRVLTIPDSMRPALR